MAAVRNFSPAQIRADRAAREAAEAATAEGWLCFAVAENLAIVLDRHPGDWGTDPEALAGLHARITAALDEATALLGTPARGIFSRSGELVALTKAPRL